MSQSSQKRRYNDDSNTVTTEDDLVFYSVATIVETMNSNEVLFKFFSSLDLALKFKKKFILEEIEDCPCSETRKALLQETKAKNFFNEMSFEGETYDKKFTVCIDIVQINGPRDSDGAFHTVVG